MPFLAACAVGAPGRIHLLRVLRVFRALRAPLVTKFLLLSTFLLGVAALACGVLHIVQLDERGDVVFAPRVDTAVLGWWVQRAETLAERGSAVGETLREAAALDAR